MALILAVGSADEDQIAVSDGRRIRQVVWQRPDFLNHVEPPNDIAVGLAGEFFVGYWTIVLLVAKALCVETHELGAIGNVVNVDRLRLTAKKRRPGMASH